MVECIIVIDFAKDPWECSKEELEYIPKPLLLKYMGHQIPLLWDKLPEYLRADSEVASYQTCHEHWNLPNCGDPIDGRAPARRDCHECRRKLAQEIKYDNTKQYNSST